MAPSSLFLLLLPALSLISCASPDSGADSGNYSDEYRLEDAIFRGYRPHLRPVRRARDRVLVNISLFALNLVSFDEQRGVATLNIFARKRWRDQLLTWNPSAYGGVSSLQLPMKRLWCPDLVLISGADPSYSPVHQPLLVLDHDGGVRWSIHMLLSVYCRLDYSGFPYETHQCDLVFEPWSYDTRQVDLALQPGGWKKDGTLNANSEWRISGMRAVRTTSVVSTSKKGTLGYARVYYRFALRRSRPLLYFYLVSPAVALAFLLPFLLLLRPSRPERLIIAFLALLGLFMLLLVQWETTPRHVVAASWPLRFLVVLWAADCLLIIWSVLAAGLWDRPAFPPPSPWLRRLCLACLAPLLLLPIRLRPKSGHRGHTRLRQRRSHSHNCQAASPGPPGLPGQRASFVRIEDEVESQLDAFDANSTTHIIPPGNSGSDSASEGAGTVLTGLGSLGRGPGGVCDACGGDPDCPAPVERLSPPAGDDYRARGEGLSFDAAVDGSTSSQWRLIVLCVDRLLFLITAVVCAVAAAACYARL